MLYLSNTQIINDYELKTLNNLSFYATPYKNDDRKYSSYKFPDSEKDIFLKKLLVWIESVLNLKLNNYENSKFDCFLIVYNVGDYFIKHSDDMYMAKKGTNRKYVAGFHINNDYIGGEYNVYSNENKFETITNQPGFTYLFDSNMHHEVNIVRSGVRKSVVVFIDNESFNTTKKII